MNVLNKVGSFVKKAAVASCAVALPVAAMAADTIDPTAMVEGINSGKAVVVAVAGAVFALVGLVVAIKFGRKSAGA